jgi:hypothetical protein
MSAGTTTKCSIVRNGEPVYQRGGNLMEIPVQTSFAMLRSAAIGGGSVAKVKDGRLRLGPESQGAAPGPACYALGGREATLTDAILLLGYLDPSSFLGGRRKLSVDHAKKVIEKNVAKPLGLSVEQAALVIRDEAVSVMAELIGNTLGEAGLEAVDTALFAFGGNGPDVRCPGGRASRHREGLRLRFRPRVRRLRLVGVRRGACLRARCRPEVGCRQPGRDREDGRAPAHAGRARPAGRGFRSGCRRVPLRTRVRA